MNEDGQNGQGRDPRPEILPPVTDGYGFVQPEAPARTASLSGWAVAPATYLLVGINCAVFALMALAGVSITNPRSADLMRWGANNGLAVLDGQQWRLLTATFVHIGVVHLATNMWCLWNLGLLGEPLLGPIGLIAVYGLSGIAGNVLSVAVHPDVQGAGASGAVFGLAGVLIILLRSKLLPVDPMELKRLRRSVIYFAVLNFALGAGTLFLRTGPRIDNFAHFGGFVSGLLIGVPLVPRIGSYRDSFVRRQWIAFGGMGFALVLVWFAVQSFWNAPAQ